MKKKSRLARKMPGTDSLWKIADRIGTLFRQANRRINWPESRCLVVNKAGELDPESFLKWAQGELDAGGFKKAGLEDMALILIFGTVVYMEEENLGLAKEDAGVMGAFGSQIIFKKMCDIATREGLKDDECFKECGGTKPAPKDWLALDAEYDKLRSQQLPKIYAALLHGYGAYGLESLCLDGSIYDRIEAYVRQHIPKMFAARQENPLNDYMKTDRVAVLTGLAKILAKEQAKILAEELVDACLRQVEEDNKPGVTGSC